jgi:hypothetical protein
VDQRPGDDNFARQGWGGRDSLSGRRRLAGGRIAVLDLAGRARARLGRRGRRRRGPEDKRLRTCLHHLNSGALQEPAQRRLRRQPRLQACRATPRHEACVEHQLQSALAGELNQGGAELAAGDVETDRRGRRGRGDDAHRRSQGCRERHHGRPAPAGRALGWLQVHRCPPPRASPESNGRGERVGRDERDPGSPWATFKV